MFIRLLAFMKQYASIFLRFMTSIPNLKNFIKLASFSKRQTSSIYSKLYFKKYIIYLFILETTPKYPNNKVKIETVPFKLPE